MGALIGGAAGFFTGLVDPTFGVKAGAFAAGVGNLGATTIMSWADDGRVPSPGSAGTAFVTGLIVGAISKGIALHGGMTIGGTGIATCILTMPFTLLGAAIGMLFVEEEEAVPRNFKLR